jgi:hypothetical protein
MRSLNAKSKVIALGDDGTMTSWYSPNTQKLRSSAKKNEKRPADMAEVVAAIDGAQHAILFLLFYPGAPNVAQWAAAAQARNKALFVRGGVTNPSASESFYYELHGTTPPKKVPGTKARRQEDPRVIAAQALSAASAPPSWLKEMLKIGFAVVHDKVVVIVIIRGNRPLAEAYASHVLDVYDHFAWRVTQNRSKAKGDGFLSVTPAQWQDKYFNADGSIRVAQLRFWLSALS